MNTVIGPSKIYIYHKSFQVWQYALEISQSTPPPVMAMHFALSSFTPFVQIQFIYIIANIFNQLKC